MMHAIAATDHVKRAGAFFALGLLLVAAALLAVSSGPFVADERSSAGAQFDLKCTANGDVQSGVSCFLVVTGLPDPLEDRVSVALFSTGGSSPVTYDDNAPSDTALASEAPAIAPGSPALVSRHLPPPPAVPPPAAALVPDPPPKSL